VFARVAGEPDPSDEPRLAVGYAMSEIILPEDIGRPAMVEKVAEGVKRAMQEAGIDDPADVHYVQTKTPLLTMDTINDAKSRGHAVVTEDPLESMNISNGTSGLGIAYALGEIAAVPTEEQIGHDLSLFSSVASCSSGVELNQAQTVVVGNVRGAGGRYRIGHSVMKDALDFEGVYEAIRSAGLDLPERARPSDIGGRLFVKCEADPTAKLRGRRQVALDDSDVHHHRHIKAAVGGVVAAAVDDAAVFVSVAAIHQGPSGGGPVAAIVDLG
jgi:ring-opening amidohydrolase-like protein